MPSLFKESVVCVSLNPRASTIQSVQCRFNVSIPSRWHHASRGQTWSPRARTAQSVPSLFSQSLRCVSLNLRASTIQSVPCRFSVSIPFRWHHASLGQTWSPRARTAQSVPSSKHDPICAMSVQCVHPISVAPRISWTNVEPSSKNGAIGAKSFQSKSSVCLS